MRHWTGVNIAPVIDPAVRDAIRRVDIQLREHDKGISDALAGGGGGGGGAGTTESYITVVNEGSLTGERALAVVAPLTKSDGGADSSLSLGITTAAHSGGYGTTALAGSAGSVIRSDARFAFPSAIMSLANLSTLTLTDDSVDQTLTGSLGKLRLMSAASVLFLPDKAGNPLSPVAGDLWRNGAALNYRKDGATTVDLTTGAGASSTEIFLDFGTHAMEFF
jgi:hypothetical protein